MNTLPRSVAAALAAIITLPAYAANEEQGYLPPINVQLTTSRTVDEINAGNECRTLERLSNNEVSQPTAGKVQAQHSAHKD